MSAWGYLHPRQYMLFFMIIFQMSVTTVSTKINEHSVQYVFPLPGAQLVSREANIIIRYKECIQNQIRDLSSFFHVQGSISGAHIGKAIISDDNRTVIFKIAKNFEPGERVSVDIYGSKLQDDFSFFFTISPNEQILPEHCQTTFSNNDLCYKNEIGIINGVSVPSDFPNFKPSIITQPLEGLLFVTTTRYLMLLQTDGTPYFYLKYNKRRVWDFTMQPNGLLSYMVGATAYTMDNHFEVIGIYNCGHGYYTDPHEFKLLPDGHALLIAGESRVIDMSELVDGGKTNANVIGTHIQELDLNKNVVFEWRCWDHYNILDALHENLAAQTIHYVHMNAIDIDYDGHLLVSSRHLDEITKINRNTGEIIWRLGGRNNQFEFVNDQEGFNYQHDIRAVAGKPDHYTLMDNGNFHVPKYSRAVEYKLDTLSMTVEKVWEYRHTPDRYTHWMGNVQRLPNGNTIIGWSYTRLPKITEVTPEGTIVYEANYTPLETCYRVHRFNWTGRATRPYLLVESHPDKVSLIFNQFVDPDIEKYYIYADTTEYPITRIDSTFNTFIHLTNLINLKTYYFRVTSMNTSGIESNYSNQVSAFINYVQPMENLILNGDFSQLFKYWILNRKNEDMAQWEIDEPGQLHVEVLSKSDDPSDVQLFQQNIKLINGKTYRLEFDAYAKQSRVIEVKLKNDTLLSDYSKFGLIMLTTQKERYNLEFLMNDFTDYQSRLVFNFAHSVGDVYLDNIFLKEMSSSAIDNNQTYQPLTCWLYKNYPNPFNASTIIRYYLPSMSRVELTFFDIVGRVVQTVKYEKQAKGDYQYIFDAQHLSSGLYFCKLYTRSISNNHQFIDTIKLICIK